MQETRMTQKWAWLKQEQRKALIPFIMAGDPSYKESQELLCALPEAGADIIEIGMPFSDPMADGPIIQQAGLRALQAGTRLSDVLAMVKTFRKQDSDTPLVLMGYYNPISHYGKDAFLQDAFDAGADSLIIVDLPFEEDEELCIPARAKGLDFIRMITPMTDEARAKLLLAQASGFVYGVSITGITGTKKAGDNAMAELAALIGNHTDLPKAIGFGIRTPEDAQLAAKYFDAVVVGSALTSLIEPHDFSTSKERILTLLKQMKAALT